MKVRGQAVDLLADVRAALHTLLRLCASVDLGSALGAYYAHRLNFRFQIYQHSLEDDLGLRAKMEDCLYSNESAKGLDDFSCSFLYFRTV